MKFRTLIAGLLIGTALSSSVRADMLVIDPSEIAKTAEEIQQVIALLRTAQQTTAAVTSIPQDLMSQVEGLMNQITSNPLGNLAVPNINTVLRGIQGVGSCAGGSQYQTSNTFYAPTGGDFAAQWIGQRGTMNSGIQACANSMLGATQSSLSQLPGLLNQLQGTQNESEATAVNGRILGQLAIIMSQLQQLMAMQHMTGNQRDTMDLQIMQKMRADEEERIRNTSGISAVTGITNTLPAPSVFVAQ